MYGCSLGRHYQSAQVQRLKRGNRFIIANSKLFPNGKGSASHDIEMTRAYTFTCRHTTPPSTPLCSSSTPLGRWGRTTSARSQVESRWPRGAAAVAALPVPLTGSPHGTLATAVATSPGRHLSVQASIEAAPASPTVLDEGWSRRRPGRPVIPRNPALTQVQTRRKPQPSIPKP